MAVHGVYVSEHGDRIGAWAHSTLGTRGWIFLGRLPPPPPGQNPKEAPAGIYRAERLCACAWGGRSPVGLLFTGRFSSKEVAGGAFSRGAEEKRKRQGGWGGFA